MRVRRRRILGGLGALLALASLPGSPTARAADTTFGGYDVTATGAAFTFAPRVPALLPVEVPLEGTLSLAFVSLSSGGQGFGRASSVWPGTLAAGLRPLIEIGGGVRLPIPDYPIVVESREFEDPKQSETPGMTMKTNVKPERAEASANSAGFVIPGVFTVGASQTVTTSVLEADRVISTATSAVNGVDILAGSMHIDSIESVATTTSDGVQATCDGTVVVTGATVGGTPVIIDENGTHASEETVAPGVDLNAPVAALLEASGVTARTLGGVSGCNGANGSHTTGGVLVSFPLPAAGSVPEGGRVDVILASTGATAGATPPFDLSPIDPPAKPPTLSEVVPRVPGPATGGVSLPTAQPRGSTSVPAPPATGGAARAVTQAPRGIEPLVYSFAGVPAPLVLGLLLAGMPGVRRVRRYMERIFAMGVAS